MKKSFNLFTVFVTIVQIHFQNSWEAVYNLMKAE